MRVQRTGCDTRASRDFPEEMRTGWQRVNSLRTGESWAPGEEPGGRVRVRVQKMVSELVVPTDVDTQVQAEGQMGGARSQRPLWPKGEPRHCLSVRVGTLTSLRLGECVWLRHGTWMSDQGLGAGQIGSTTPIVLFFCFFWPCRARDRTSTPPAMEAWSLNHWTTREDPTTLMVVFIFGSRCHRLSEE